MPQCAWTTFNHKTTLHDAVTIFRLGDPSMGFHDVPFMDLALCDSCAKIYRIDVEPDPARRFETPLNPMAMAVSARERLFE